MPDPEAAKTRASAIALISIAFLGVLLFLLAALAPVYAGLSGGGLPSAVLAALGALMLSFSIIGALLLALLGHRKRQN